MNDVTIIGAGEDSYNPILYNALPEFNRAEGRKQAEINRMLHKKLIIISSSNFYRRGEESRARTDH